VQYTLLHACPRPWFSLFRDLSQALSLCLPPLLFRRYRPHHHHAHAPPRFHNGVEAEVHFDASIDVTVEWPKPQVSLTGAPDEDPLVHKHMHMPCPLFKSGMYCRAKITAYDYAAETYELEYVDGPYCGDEEPDGHVAFQLPDQPRAKFRLHHVKGAFVSVDMSDNYASHWPVFLLLVSAAQVLAFLYFVYAVMGKDAEADSPVGGPKAWWMRVVGEFPGCGDLRPEWWRLWSHQLVHAGYSHLVNNMVMQVVFGLPINMVHGNLRFAAMYELGVVGGGLSFVLLGGGQNALVGCSGGVYCIVGIHVAELVMNWESAQKGLLNHWTRLGVMLFLVGLDFYLYDTGPSETTSYSAHIGGFLTGAVFGCVLLENLEVTWFERTVLLPAVWVFACGLTVWAVANYSLNFPPWSVYGVDEDSCCVQLIECEQANYLDASDYASFACSGGTSVTKANGRTVLEHNCTVFAQYALTQLGR
jgi:rhomboid-related protein 1/2/3